MYRSHYLLATLALLISPCTAEQDTSDAMPAPVAETTIMELMVATITPATDTLWGADDPQTDADWQVLDDAAVAVIETFEQVRNGGGGPNDDAWASEARFQAYIDEDIAAAEAARAAIAARDLDALFAAGDALYSPCENCHIDFNPGVEGEAQ
jgi:cytochrome c556